ncbi:Rpn family recombination-promoting nuclease/putative transposase [Pantoea sp. A4]|uniref:Rpn family recombination-promoting nuclease/putative transposase n=1 Tax=Pantoea sp. A4 TaxID=1225184 RepID=UPI00035CCD50|nr:Rpn family recombination-promoting nuclease/putative transposase [Pantoea sp. A4]
MKKPCHNPHDATFRLFLTDIEVARTFLEIHLPTGLRKLCDFSTLRPEPISFVDEDLQQYCSDVLYSMQNKAGNTSYIHVLIEHQSSPDAHMAFRMIRYAIAAMHRHLQAGNKKLPIVVPLLFYTGKSSPYPHSTCWLDEFEDPELAAQIYGNAFALIDVTTIPDEEIMEHRHMAALTLLQKHILQRDLSEISSKLFTVLTAGYLSSPQLISLLHYMFHTGETSNAQVFIQKLSQKLPEQKEQLMTIAEQLKQEGWEEGREEGKLETMEKIVQRLLRQGKDMSTIQDLIGLSDSDIEKIKH